METREVVEAVTVEVEVPLEVTADVMVEGEEADGEVPQLALTIPTVMVSAVSTCSRHRLDSRCMADFDEPPPPPPAGRTREHPPRPLQRAGSAAQSADGQCKCRVLAAERTVVKESANKGRKFRSCGNQGACDFFEWVDGPPPSASVSTSNSRTIPSKRTLTERSVRPNHIMAQACTLIFAFRLQYKSTDAASNNNIRCKCDMTAIKKTVVKDGVNKGRVFWTCPNSEKARCGFFEWDNGPGSSGGGGRDSDSGQGGSQPTGECFKVRFPLFTSFKPNHS